MKKNILVISILIIFNILIYKANAQTLDGTIDNYPYFQTAVKLYSNGKSPEPLETLKASKRILKQK